MTHILDDGAGGYLTAESGVLCGQKLRRSAISRSDFNSYLSAGRLRKDKMCKPCMEKAMAAHGKNRNRESEE